MNNELRKTNRYPGRLLYKKSQNLLGEWPKILGEMEELKRLLPSLEFAHSFISFHFFGEDENSPHGLIEGEVGREVIGPILPGQVMDKEFQVRDSLEKPLVVLEGQLPFDFSFKYLKEIVEEMKSSFQGELEKSWTVGIDFSQNKGKDSKLPYKIEIAFK